MYKIYLIGIDHKRISNQADQELRSCNFIFCTNRFYKIAESYPGEILDISPLADALASIKLKLRHGNVAILASGDPMFFGIGRTLLKHFDKQQLTVHPAISSIQQAFAAFKLPWDNSVFISMHGRPLQEISGLLLKQHKLGILTDSLNTPDLISSMLLEIMAPDSCRVMVAENLGETNEKLSSGNLKEISQKTFSALNVMIITKDKDKDKDKGKNQSFVFGLHENEIKHSRGLITKNEVRAAVLHQLRLPANGVFWDIGAGSGSISIEAARLCNNLTIFAMEQSQEQHENVEHNRKEFQLLNMHLIKGKAPNTLAELPAPDRVFIGGSGGNLPEIIKTSAVALRPNGLIVMTAVIEDTRRQGPALLHEAGLQVAISTINVTRSTYPPGEDTKFNKITIITGTK